MTVSCKLDLVETAGTQEVCTAHGCNNRQCEHHLHVDRYNGQAAWEHGSPIPSPTNRLWLNDSRETQT